MLFWVQLFQRRLMPADNDVYRDLKERVCRTLDLLATYPGVHGGVPTGGRALCFVAEATDQVTLDAMLQGLPIWDVMDEIEVIPLVSFSSRLAYNRRGDAVQGREP